MHTIHNQARRISGPMFFFALITLFVTGCAPSNSIVGKWTTQVSNPGGALTTIFEFSPDGTMTQSVVGANSLISCTYTVKGNTLTIIPVKTTLFGKSFETPQSTKTPQVYSFKIYGDSLTLTTGQTEIIFTRSYV